ncbi:MAG TPA: aspartate aminotransferase family protein [Planctomycetaceae bacterium]|nr:aspartate aminotransferase family protein [Planctomycetaceae bacterium]
MSGYRDILLRLRQSFPQPISDRFHDAYFVFSIMRTLDAVDRLKSDAPLLGQPAPLDYDTAMKTRVADEPLPIEDVHRQLVERLEGMPIWGHPLSQINVVATPTIASVIGSLLPAIYNPNLASDETSFGVAQAEAMVTAMTADLIGYDPDQASGVFTFGGTGALLYGVKLGIEKAFPDAIERGVPPGGVLLASTHSHYAKLNVAGWLGLGEQNVIHIPTHLDNSINVEELEAAARRAIELDKRIAAFIACLGTTDAFGLDNLDAIVDLRDRLVQEYELDYRPHVHADAVIGWAWSVFNDYDFEQNELGFRPRTIRALAAAHRVIRHLHRADSVGIDFHKTGFAPYISTLFLVKDQSDMRLLVRGREEMPYLFQSGQRHPAMFTLETSRGGGGVLAALANLRLFGKQGLRALLGHLVEMAEWLREHLEGHACTTVLNPENVGTVTLFRVYPDGVDTWTIKDRELHDPDAGEDVERHNEFNRQVFQYLHERAMQGKGVHLSKTECYRTGASGIPIVGLKSYILTPFIEQAHTKLLVDTVLEAREAVMRGGAPATT